MTITDLASDTWLLDLDQPEDISVASIAQWYRSHIGDLNNLINNGYSISNSYEIIDDSGNSIDINAVSIFKKLYDIHYLKKQSKSFLGANAVESIAQVTQDGITVRGIDKNNIAKSYTELYKEAKLELKNLLNNYKFNRGSLARQVEGDDRLPRNTPLIVDPLNNASAFNH